MIEIDPLVTNVTSVFDDEKHTKSRGRSSPIQVLIPRLFENTIFLPNIYGIPRPSVP